MSNWTEAELNKIAAADDLHVSPFREDGKTYGTPTWIWSAVVDDGLYARGYNGRSSRWYKAAEMQKAGRVRIAGMEREVAFESANGELNDRIDEAYRVKYRTSSYLAPMIGDRARVATVKISPR
jgi:hypothetical protein